MAEPKGHSSSSDSLETARTGNSSPRTHITTRTSVSTASEEDMDDNNDSSHDVSSTSPSQSTEDPPNPEQRAPTVPMSRFVDMLGSIVSPYGVPGYQIRVVVHLETTDSTLVIPHPPRSCCHAHPIYSAAECGSVVVPTRPGYQIRIAMYLECTNLTALPQGLPLPVAVPIVPMGVPGMGATRDGDETIGNPVPRAP